MLLRAADWLYGKDWDGPAWHIWVPLTAVPLLTALILSLLFWA
jgi:hypothetical protein